MTRSRLNHERLNICRQMRSKITESSEFPEELTFLMRQLSTSLAKLTSKNCRIWGWEKPQEVGQYERDSLKLSVWCVIRKSRIIGPFFFEEGTENVERYLTILQDFLISELRQLNLLDRAFFQKDLHPATSLPISDIYGMTSPKQVER